MMHIIRGTIRQVEIDKRISQSILHALIQRCNIAPFIYVCETIDLYILTFSETGVFFAIGICQYINAIKRQARDKLDDPAATPSKKGRC